MIRTMLMNRKDGARKVLEFDEDEITVGRMPNNDLVLKDGKISKRHALIAYESDVAAMVITDFRSANGTKVNGEKISGRHVLAPDDKIQIAAFIIEVEGGPDCRATFGGLANPLTDDDWGSFPESGVGNIPDDLDDWSEADTIEHDPNDEEDYAADAAPAAPKLRPTPGSVSRVDPNLKTATVYLRRYVALEKQHRLASGCAPCRCGQCVICRADRLLAARDS